MVDGNRASVKVAERSARVAEIRRSLELLHKPGSTFEIRVLGIPSRGKPYNASGYFNDHAKAAEMAYEYDRRGAAGVYVTTNPVLPALLARAANRMVDYPKHSTADTEIVKWRRLFIDIDPDRPTGIAATEDERQAAVELGSEIEDVLRNRGWSYPLLVDSGNGGYLLYSVDLPNTDEITALIKRFYAGLQTLIDGKRPAHIDAGVFNAARIIRIGGTTNRKGDSTPDRPHRRCEYREPIAECPIETISPELIQAVADLAPQPATKPATATHANDDDGHYRSRLDVARWLSDRSIVFRTKAVDRGIAYLVPCPFDPNHGGHGEAAVMQADSGLLTFECKHSSCQGRRWADYRDAIGKPDGDHYDPPIHRNGKDNAPSARESAAAETAFRAVEPGTAVNAVDRQTSGTVVQDLGDRCVVRLELPKSRLILPDGSPLASGGEAPEPPPFAKLIQFDDFLQTEFPDDEIIPGVIVGGQPGVIGARLKCMKTHMACELAVSLASQTKFCGHFDVARQCRVAIWSGESGRRKVQRILTAQRETHGIISPIPLFLNFALPKLSLQEHLEVLHDVITKNEIDVCIFDPLYMALLTANNAGLAGNVYAMGVVLEPLTQLGQATNCTIEACHHFKKTVAVDQDEPCSLEELSQAGVAEWAGQWILFARRSSYQSDGKHELYMRVGGRAGHASFWALDIDEGHPADGPAGQKWELAIRPVSDARAEAKKAAEKRKIEQRERQDSEDRRKMLEALRQCPDGDTKNALRGPAGLNGERAADALRSLVGSGHAEMFQAKKYTRMETFYKPTGK